MASDRPAGSLGPRLAGRLTAELILRSPQYMSCIKLYELSLRGNKISAIENLGATENQFDSIDLTDNAIVRLEGFSRLPRLKHLYLSNNRVTRIARGLEASIPNLELLMLANSRISNLQDLDPLATLPKLTHLCLTGSPVAMKQDYRLYTISKLKHLKFLDFKKVKQKEREAAQQKSEALSAHAANTFEPAEDLEAAQAAVAGQAAEAQEAEPKASAGPTQDQLTAIKAAIAGASTLEEIKRLEEMLVSGNTAAAMQVDEHANGNSAKPDAMDVG